MPSDACASIEMRLEPVHVCMCVNGAVAAAAAEAEHHSHRAQNASDFESGIQCSTQTAHSTHTLLAFTTRISSAYFHLSNSHFALLAISIPFHFSFICVFVRFDVSCSVERIFVLCGGVCDLIKAHKYFFLFFLYFYFGLAFLPNT